MGFAESPGLTRSANENSLDTCALTHCSPLVNRDSLSWDEGSREMKADGAQEKVFSCLDRLSESLEMTSTRPSPERQFPTPAEVAEEGLHDVEPERRCYDLSGNGRSSATLVRRVWTSRSLFARSLSALLSGGLSDNGLGASGKQIAIEERFSCASTITYITALRRRPLSLARSRVCHRSSSNSQRCAEFLSEKHNTGR